MIVPDADWPRNGDIVVGSEIPDVPGKCIQYVYCFGGINQVSYLHFARTKVGFGSKTVIISPWQAMTARFPFYVRYQHERHPQILK